VLLLAHPGSTGGLAVTLAFQSLGSILLGYSLVFGITGLYALVLLRRGRNLARRLPDDDKPWT
jgi:hypothetical protein